MSNVKNAVWAKVMAVVALCGAMAGAVQAGPVGGGRHDVHYVAAGGTDVFHLTFRAGEEAVVAIDGDGDTDLDLYVYDENGNLIACDNDHLDTCIVRFYPRWTGTFVIKVRNMGRVFNQYKIYAV